MLQLVSILDAKNQVVGAFNLAHVESFTIEGDQKKPKLVMVFISGEKKVFEGHDAEQLIGVLSKNNTHYFSLKPKAKVKKDEGTAQED